ncbi:MAG TPA: GH116 family glycosyl-hydrolase [Candidatus Anammoximicrobium sp.]|nr:GH116 family glycosyl-hydrolase [Candidatus Anammoximicrobium sp.]
MRNCSCSGGKCESAESVALSRREFLGRLAVGSAGLTLLAQLPWLEQARAASAAAQAANNAVWPDYAMTPPRVYRGQYLEAVGMPIGGIGTGSIWLDGQGRLGVWQIFNNLSETRIPDSFFAVSARTGNGPAVTRLLQAVREGPLPPVQEIEYEGGYPIARLKFRDDALPVQVTLEGFNPLIPLDTANSSIPCAIFRITARNSGQQPVDVTLLATLQNAVGSQGSAGIQDVRFPGYGGNRNRVVRDGGMIAVAMDKSPDPVQSGSVKVRSAAGPEVPGPELLWLVRTGAFSAQAAEALTGIVADGGVALLDGLEPGFFEAVAKLRGETRDLASLATLFEDFEKKSYEGWTLTGDAFGKQPSRGTEAGQQPVSGFAGRGLVNTFIAGDGPQGTATSKPFRIERRYIGFLIGGGAHAGRTCMNLKVDGQVVRTATGKNLEALEPASWDVADLKGKDAVVEIVDRDSGGWGHINVDQILFSDVPPEPLLKQGTAAETLAKAITLPFEAAEEAKLPAEQKVRLTDDTPAELRSVADAWQVTRFTRLSGVRSGEKGYRVVATTPAGDPLIVAGPLGKGRIILVLAPGLPWSWGSVLLAASSGVPLKPGERLVPGTPGWGTMALAALDDQALALPAWSAGEGLAAFVAEPAGTQKAAGEEAVSGPGETVNAALGVPFTLPPGQQRTVTFAITWHFPNVKRFQHSGNLYSRRWLDALAVARDVAQHCDMLWAKTQLYHQTVYQSNLPEEFLDAMTSQSVILRGPTCFWSEDGYFGGFEGSYGCCPLNCTHVWNYAQTHARLFPEVGRNMRVSDFITYLHETGETSHRQHSPHKAFTDGHCACIEGAYREYQLCPDTAFLAQVWPGVKKAVDWLIEAIDKTHEGLPTGHQLNTYDCAVSGPNTFIGSQYLSALAAAERMAAVMDDADSAARWRAVREAGMKNQNDKLWNGECYIQIPEERAANDYNNGCHSDQLLGQWWAHMLDLGYLYPVERIRGALEAIMRHNFREQFAGFKQAPRRYIPDDEGGLLMCTWPHNDRPKPFIVYADEVWTGIEYAVAGAMVYEDQLERARRIVRMARSRYDGRRRDGLNSGPGGNPFNELECGKFYARAMSSWSLLIACQGLVLEGPRGILGFRPKWQPQDHRSFFTACEGWGLFVQRREPGRQTDRIEVRYGKLRVRELVFELPADAGAAEATLTIAGRTVPAAVRRDGQEVRLALESEVLATEGETLEVSCNW